MPAGSYQTFTTPNWCFKKWQKKTSTFERQAKQALKVHFSLKPWKSGPHLSSRVKEVSLSPYLILVHSNFQKNNTFERFSLSLSIPLFHSSLRLFLLQMAWAIHLSIPTFGKTFLFIFGWFRPCLKINFKKWEKFSKKWSITSGLILLTSQKWQFSVAILYIRSIKRGKLLLLYMRQRDLLFLGSLC